jgi:hypothetical protein
MVRENIVDNNFILYGDQIGMIKDSLVAHKYTISNIVEHSKKRGDLEHKNIWESFVQDIHELSQLFTKLDEMVAEHKIHAISCHLLSPEFKDEVSSDK